MYDYQRFMKIDAILTPVFRVVTDSRRSGDLGGTSRRTFCILPENRHRQARLQKHPE
jgi:hypothetical protein